MAKIAQDKRMKVTVWAIVAALLLAIAALSFNAYADDEASKAASSSSSASSSASLAEEPEDASAPQAPSAATAQEGSEQGASTARQMTKVDRALQRDAVPRGVRLGSLDHDSAGTVFTYETPLERLDIGSDLYWASISRLVLIDSRVGNDVLGAGYEVHMSNSTIGGDVRVAGQTIDSTNVVVRGNADLVALDVTIDANSAATGYYCGGGTINYEGTSKRLIAYGQSIHFDGYVDGDVTLSAQDIYIGPHAVVTGTLDVRSGQTLEALEVPSSARIANIDTTLNHPNTIDQITQIRAAIAPYFQVGSLLFIVVSFILLALAMLWGFGQKLAEAHRLIVRYPLAVLVLGLIALMLVFVVIMLGSLLVFTIPFSLVVAFALIISIVICIPFTGASMTLMFLGKRWRPWLCVTVGSGLGGALLFVPYLNMVVFVCSLIYFVGYIVNIGMFGHDREHDASYHRRVADEDAPHSVASGILPVAPAGADPSTATAPVKTPSSLAAQDASGKTEGETVEEAEAEPAVDSEVATQVEAQAGVEAESEAGPESAAEAEPEPVVEPAAEPEPEPEPEPAATDEPRI